MGEETVTQVRGQAGLKLWVSLVLGPNLLFMSSDFTHMCAVTLLPVKHISASLVEGLQPPQRSAG